ncbi:MAG: hypothetical protein JJT82_01580 [Legionellaceae bacterium]|nr:hypothetical protein [Legionellaceae bacterium]
MTNYNKAPLQELLNDFGVITYEIANCKRQIMAWVIIGKSVKSNTDAEIDNFFGWCQDAFNRLIVIDAYKIYRDSKKYIQTILQKSAYSHISDKLLQKSDFSQRLTTLGRIIRPLQNYRNKRFAHIESYTLEGIKLYLVDLSAALENLSASVSFIIHYVSNPQYISSLDDNEKVYFTLGTSEATLEALEHQLKNDSVFKMMSRAQFLFNHEKADLID